DSVPECGDDADAPRLCRIGVSGWGPTACRDQERTGSDASLVSEFTGAPCLSELIARLTEKNGSIPADRRDCKKQYGTLFPELAPVWIGTSWRQHTLSPIGQGDTRACVDVAEQSRLHRLTGGSDRRVDLAAAGPCRRDELCFWAVIVGRPTL